MPIWAIDLDGAEEKKSTEFKLMDLSSRNFTKVVAEYNVKEKIFQGVYAAIDMSIPSKTEARGSHANSRYNGEESIIRGEVHNYIKVDLENNIAYVFNPETKEPALIYKIGKEVFKFATNEALPVAASTVGAATHAVGNVLVKVTENAESYKTNFYKKYFPEKYKAASKVNSTVTKGAGKFLKGGGLLLKGVGRLLNAASNFSTFYETLNPSPGPMSNDQLKELTNNAMKKYLSNINTPTNKASNTTSNQQPNIKTDKKE